MLKIGVQTGGWYDHDNALKSFEYIKECGFEAVDYNIDIYMRPDPMAKDGVITPTLFDKPIEEIIEWVKPLKDASEATGVEISQMHAPFPCWYPEKDDLNAHIVMALDKCFAVAEYINCPAVVVHPTILSERDVEWEENLDFYRGLIPYIKKYKGVKICTENIFGRHGSRFVEGRLSNPYDAAKMIDILNEEAGGDYFGFCLDVGHANLCHLDLKNYIKIMGKRLTIFHIHDNNAMDDLHMIPYSYLTNGKTHVCDWNRFIEGIKEIGFEGTLAFETFRIFSAYPKPAHTSALKLIADIGHYWVDLIENK